MDMDSRTQTRPERNKERVEEKEEVSSSVMHGERSDKVIRGKRGIVGYQTTQAGVLKINPSIHLIHHPDILSLFKFKWV